MKKIYGNVAYTKLVFQKEFERVLYFLTTGENTSKNLEMNENDYIDYLFFSSYILSLNKDNSYPKMFSNSYNNVSFGIVHEKFVENYTIKNVIYDTFFPSFNDISNIRNRIFYKDLHDKKIIRTNLSEKNFEIITNKTLNGLQNRRNSLFIFYEENFFQFLKYGIFLFYLSKKDQKIYEKLISKFYVFYIVLIEFFINTYKNEKIIQKIEINSDMINFGITIFEKLKGKNKKIIGIKNYDKVISFSKSKYFITGMFGIDDVDIKKIFQEIQYGNIGLGDLLGNGILGYIGGLFKIGFIKDTEDFKFHSTKLYEEFMYLGDILFGKKNFITYEQISYVFKVFSNVTEFEKFSNQNYIESELLKAIYFELGKNFSFQEGIGIFNNNEILGILKRFILNICEQKITCKEKKNIFDQQNFFNEHGKDIKKYISLFVNFILDKVDCLLKDNGNIKNFDSVLQQGKITNFSFLKNSFGEENNEIEYITFKKEKNLGGRKMFDCYGYQQIGGQIIYNIQEKYDFITDEMGKLKIIQNLISDVFYDETYFHFILSFEMLKEIFRQSKENTNDNEMKKFIMKYEKEFKMGYQESLEKFLNQQHHKNINLEYFINNYKKEYGNKKIIIGDIKKGLKEFEKIYNINNL